MSERVAHKWDQASLRQSMKIEEASDTIYGNLPFVLDPSEAERYVESLQSFEIEDVGSSKWMEQHSCVEKLNLQAHQSALTNSDEFVLEAILTFGKLEVLVNDLVIIEAWKEQIYPLLLDRVAGRNNMRVYFILYHEATVVNLLEVLLFHRHVCEGFGERILEIVDYCAKKLARLNGGYNFRAHEPLHTAVGRGGMDAKELAVALEMRTPQEELSQYLTEIEFRVCISAVSIARLITEHADALPLSISSRITDTHDFLVLTVPLIENPPWTRRLDNGTWQKLIEQKWTIVPPIDLLKITKLEGQPWLMLYHLVAKDVFRSRYHLNSFRKQQLLRVRKYVNEVLLDQLPFLADIQRYMDELAISEVPESTASLGSAFLFEQVASGREKLVKGKDWDAIAEFQMEKIFTMTDKDDKDVRRMAELYSDESIESLMDPEAVSSKNMNDSKSPEHGNGATIEDVDD